MSAGMADWLRTRRSIHRLDRKAHSNHRGRLALLVRRCEVRTNELALVARKVSGLADTFRMSAVKSRHSSIPGSMLLLMPRKIWAAFNSHASDAGFQFTAKLLVYAAKKPFAELGRSEAAQVHRTHRSHGSCGVTL